MNSLQYIMQNWPWDHDRMTVLRKLWAIRKDGGDVDQALELLLGDDQAAWAKDENAGVAHYIADIYAEVKAGREEAVTGIAAMPTKKGVYITAYSRQKPEPFRVVFHISTPDEAKEIAASIVEAADRVR